VLVVVTPVGGSRQRIASDVADAPEGPVWFRHVARLGEKGRPYFGLSQFFPDLGIDAASAPEDAEQAVRDALDEVQEGQPRLVLANADLCDPESLHVLTTVAAAGRLRLIVTLTPQTTPDQLPQLVGAEVLDVPPLDTARVSEMLRVRFGARPHPLLVDLLMNRTRGSYSAVRDIADASFAGGKIVIVEDVLVPSPAAPAEDCFDTWLTPKSVELLGGDAEGTDLIELTALLGQLDVADARHCASPAVIDAIATHGTFVEEDGRLVFAWRAEEMLVLRGLSADRQRELYDRFATRIARTLALPSVAVRAADWWLAVDRRLPVDLAERAAREANLLGRHRRAIVYSDPDVNEEGRGVALIERALALAELGDDAELQSLLSAIDPATLTEDELLVYLQWSSPGDGPAERHARVERAVAADDPTLRRRRAAVGTLAELVRHTFDAASDDIINRLRALAFSSQLSPCNRAVAFAVLSSVLRHAGRPAQAVGAAEFALRILAEEHDTASAFHLDMARELHVMALVSAADLDGAEEAARRYSAGVYAHPGSGRMTPALQVWVALFQGDLQGAIASAYLCLAGIRPTDPHQVRGWMEAVLAHVLIQSGRTDEAQDYLAAAERHPSRRRLLDLERRMAMAVVHDALAEPEEALRILADVADEAQAHGLKLTLIDATVLSVQIGGPPHLPMLREVVDDLVDPSGTPLVWQTFARAVGDYDLAALVELADDLSARGSRLLAAEVAQYVLDMARRSTDLDADTRARLRDVADLS
jgi:hypothetical protein